MLCLSVRNTKKTNLKKWLLVLDVSQSNKKDDVHETESETSDGPEKEDRSNNTQVIETIRRKRKIGVRERDEEKRKNIWGWS